MSRILNEDDTILTIRALRSQYVELFSWSSPLLFCSSQLPLANRVHDFNPGNRTTRRPKRFEAEQGMRDVLDRSLALFHEVVEIF